MLLYTYYTDGQKIAKKLTSQISRETRSIKSLLSEYHTCLSITNVSSSEVITLDETLNPSTIAKRLRNQCFVVASGEERQLIDAFVLLRRSTEEVCMIKEESRCVVTYYQERKQAILRVLEEFSGTQSYGRGAKAMLHQLLSRVAEQLELAHKTAEIVNSEVHVHQPTGDDNDLPWSDIDSPSDSSDSED